jgi:hypothetical protein
LLMSILSVVKLSVVILSLAILSPFILSDPPGRPAHGHHRPGRRYPRPGPPPPSAA